MKKLVLLFTMIMLCNVVLADNLVMNYLKKWVDETRIEKAIGKVLLEEFVKVLPKEFSIKEDHKLSQKFNTFFEKCGVKNNSGLELKVMIIESSIPDEILLPGGTLILTKGYLSYAASEEQQDFIFARNAYLTFQKQPLAVIKHEGIYPKFLDYIKLKESKRSEKDLRELLRAYLSVIRKMNHKKADVQGALLTSNPEKTRLGAIKMLSQFNVTVWPPSPFDTVDLPSRISDLENLKLPEKNL